MKLDEDITPGLHIEPNETGFLVFHTPSGKWLDWFATHRRAQEATRELGQLGDWTKSERAVLRFGKRRVKRILDKHRF